MTALHQLTGRRALFFGGKGGVGKTTVASAFALGAAARGTRTLLVSTDPAPSTSDILEQPLTDAPREVTENLWAFEIDPAREADRYIDGVKSRIADSTPPRLAAEVDRQIDIARVSPGAEEAALFERFASILETEALEFDLIVFDTAPTGHTLRLLTLPEMMHAWMAGLISRRRKVNTLARMWRNVAGAAAGDDRPSDDPVLDALRERQRRFERTRTVISDPAQAGFVFVVIPERLPILETERAVSVLTRYGIPIGGIIVNRVIPSHADGAFLSRRRDRERAYLDRIRTVFPDHDLSFLPLLDRDVHGLASLREVADMLMADG